MKKIYIYLFLSCFSTTIFANELHPKQEASLFEHMVTVNKEWKTQQDLPQELMQLSIHFDSDTERIQTHLQLVSSILDKRDHHLSKEVLASRKNNLKSLVSYWKDGIFPINSYHEHRQPYFIDNYGTACAVGHLLQTSGQEALAEQISNEMNYAYIRELAYPQLNDWAKLNGFTKEELAWIQPAYSGGDCVIGVNAPGQGSYTNPASSIKIMKNHSSYGTLVGGNFSLATGNSGTATSLAIYTGIDYISFPADIVGTVYDFVVDPNGNDIYVVGDFVVSGTNSRNIIKTDLNTWTGLQTGTMNGAVRNVVIHDCNLYISGDFTTVDGQNLSGIAAYSLQNSAWTNQPTGCSGTQYPDVLSTNGAINDMIKFNNQIVIGGTFNQVGSSNTPVGLSFYDQTGWTTSYINNLVGPVDHLVDYNGSLLIGGNSIYRYDQGWHLPNTISTPGCHNFSKSGPFDALYTIGAAPNSALVSRIGLTTEMLSWHQPIFNGNKLNVFLGNGSLNTGVVRGNEIFLGGNYLGTEIQSERGCFVSYDCFTLMNSQHIGKLMTFDVVLPLELSEFTAKLNEETNIVDLNWKTLSEHGIDKFVVERSIDLDGIGFEPIGEVIAVGESTSSVSYELPDDINRFVAPNIYYRLKIVEKSGLTEYSKVVVIQQKAQDLPKFRVYPNPSEGALTVNINGSGENSVSLSVYDVQGKLYIQEELELQDSFISKEYDLNHLNQGLYFVRVTNSKNSYVSKIELLK